jgi:hypothetical protein
MNKLLQHVARNRAYWDDLARQYAEAGERAWAKEESTWEQSRVIPSSLRSGLVSGRAKKCGKRAKRAEQYQC